MQAALTRLKNAGHREFFAPLHRVDFQMEHILRSIDIHIVGKPFLPLSVGPGNDFHASIHQSGGIHRQPYGNDLCRSLRIVAPGDH